MTSCDPNDFDGGVNEYFLEAFFENCEEYIKIWETEVADQI